MPRYANDNLEEALQMARLGTPFRDAWVACSKRKGGATSWGNANRTWKAEVKARAAVASAGGEADAAAMAEAERPAQHSRGATAAGGVAGTDPVGRDAGGDERWLAAQGR